MTFEAEDLPARPMPQSSSSPPPIPRLFGDTEMFAVEAVSVV